MRYVVTGGAGFIGSHLTDLLMGMGHEVTVYDNLRSGFMDNVNKQAEWVRGDINSTGHLAAVAAGCDGLFHLAAIARTPWCIDDPVLAGLTNSQGSLSVLEACRQVRCRRVVCASSNVVYAANTPYRASKEMVELWVRCYAETYGLSATALRFSNVYGPRQSELGPSPNVFAAFRKSLRENGYIAVTGDGEQSRDFTHVSDIVRGLWAAMNSTYSSPSLDLCTGKRWTMNEVCRMWNAPVKYIAERPGDVKHIVQNPAPAMKELMWKAVISLPEGIKDVL